MLFLSVAKDSRRLPVQPSLRQAHGWNMKVNTLGLAVARTFRTRVFVLSLFSCPSVLVLGSLYSPLLCLFYSDSISKLTCPPPHQIYHTASCLLMDGGRCTWGPAPLGRPGGPCVTVLEKVGV